MLQKLLFPLLKDSRKVSVAEFILKMVLIYSCWKVFFWYAEQESLIHSSWIQFQDWLAKVNVNTCVFFLRDVFHYVVTFNDRDVIIDGTMGVRIKNHCLGLPAMVVFTGFILSYSGSWQQKLWFIPFGIIAVYFINNARLWLLNILQIYSTKEFWRFNHSYTYVILTYGLIFLLVAWWMNKFSDPTTRPK